MGYEDDMDRNFAFRGRGARRNPAFGRRRNLRMPKSLMLPLGNEFIVGQQKLNKKGTKVMIKVAVPAGPGTAELEEQAGKIARAMLLKKPAGECLIPVSVETAMVIHVFVPALMLFLPYGNKGFVPVNVTMLLGEDPNCTYADSADSLDVDFGGTHGRW